MNNLTFFLIKSRKIRMPALCEDFFFLSRKIFYHIFHDFAFLVNGNVQQILPPSSDECDPICKMFKDFKNTVDWASCPVTNKWTKSNIKSAFGAVLSITYGRTSTTVCPLCIWKGEIARLVDHLNTKHCWGCNKANKFCPVCNAPVPDNLLGEHLTNNCYGFDWRTGVLEVCEIIDLGDNAFDAYNEYMQDRKELASTFSS